MIDNEPTSDSPAGTVAVFLYADDVITSSNFNHTILDENSETCENLLEDSNSTSGGDSIPGLKQQETSSLSVPTEIITRSDEMEDRKSVV